MHITLLNLTLALAAVELFHRMFGIFIIRPKFDRIKAFLNKQPYTEDVVNIKTDIQGYVVSAFLYVLGTAGLFAFYAIINIETTKALELICVLITASYLAGSISTSNENADIETMTDKLKDFDAF